MSVERESVPVGVTIPRRLLERVDAYRDATGVTRSALVVVALQDYLAQREMIQKAVQQFVEKLPEMMPQVVASIPTQLQSVSESMKDVDVSVLMLESLKKADLSGIEGKGDADGK